jgi:Uma2 family endonuclease
MSLIEEETAAIEQFLRFPEIRPPLEYHGGRAIQKMSPKLRHSILQGEFFLELTNHARPSGLGGAFVELRCTFKGGSYVFDVSFFRAERLPDPQVLDERSDLTVAPDLAIEVLSPGQTVGELRKKLRSAIRGGLRLGWLIDPIHKQVLIPRPRRKAEILRPGDHLSGEDVLPGFSLSVDVIFGWLGGNRPSGSAGLGSG